MSQLASSTVQKQNLIEISLKDQNSTIKGEITTSGGQVDLITGHRSIENKRHKF